MVTIIHPTGFEVGVFATGVVVAAIERRRTFGFAPTLPSLIPTPPREQLIASAMRSGRKAA